MTKLEMWMRAKMAAYYRKKMDDAMKKSLDYEHVGDSELGTYWYQKYLAYKRKYKQIGRHN